MHDPATIQAINKAIAVLAHAQALLLMVFNDNPEDLASPSRKAVLGKHVREIEDTLRLLRQITEG